jgi:predicted ester cyclase
MQGQFAERRRCRTPADALGRSGIGWTSYCQSKRITFSTGVRLEEGKVDKQDKKDQIARVFDALNRRALDELDHIFDPAHVDHSPMGDLHGIPAFKDNVQVWLAGFPDLRFEVLNIIVDGDLAAWQTHVTGTNTGSLMGMPPTGKQMDITDLHMGRFSEDGRPVEHWIGFDRMRMMEQLGLVPESTGAPAAS